MSKSANRKIRHLKNHSIWPSVILFLSSLIIGAVSICMTASAVIVYLVESEYVSAYSETLGIKESIEKQKASGVSYIQIVSDIEKETSHPLGLCIVDKYNNVIASYGSKLDLEDSIILGEDLDVDIYLDSNARLDKNKLNINPIEILEGLGKMDFEKQAPDAEMMETLNQNIYTFSYWIRRDSTADDISILIKYEQSLNFNDFLIVVLMMALSGLVFFILNTVHFVNTISSIVSQQKMLKMVLTNPVTGGNNYLAFSNYVIRALHLPFNKKYDYAFVDLSLLKYQKYCTLYGTELGERLLTAVDKCLKSYVRTGEVYGSVANGDFALFLRRDSKNNQTALEDRVARIIEKLPGDIQTLYGKGGTAVLGLNNVKFKAGVYIIPAAKTEQEKKLRKAENFDVDELLIKAGIAKQAITEDSGMILYNHDMWEKELWEQKVQDNMQAALDAQEFQVYIQPKYNPSTEKLAGGEALVRWISPTEGFVPPGKFIPIFEKTGFITKLDDYMIVHTAELQAKWLKEGKKIVPISVNVSRAHFAQPDLAEHIRDLVDLYPVPHEYIEIELTESAFFDDKQALLSTVKKLQDYGFEVSMDDFGAGYSSLNSLKDLPLNVLKLDAEFFRGDDFDTRGEIVVSEAISLAKQLNMRIVAEGVEKKEQVDFLASKDCDMIQGFYFAKPMPANEYESRMES